MFGFSQWESVFSFLVFFSPLFLSQKIVTPVRLAGCSNLQEKLNSFESDIEMIWSQTH